MPNMCGSDNMVMVEEDNNWRMIFPVEIWLMILENLDDTDDLFQCAMASPFLKTLLEPKKNTYLFPTVLNLLDRNSYLKASTPSGLPEISRSLLRCRLVCHGWKNALNRFLEIRPYHFICRQFPRAGLQLPHQALEDPTYHTQFRLYNFSQLKLTQHVLPELESSADYFSKNSPSPSRHLHIREFRKQYINNAYFRFKYPSLTVYRLAVEEFLRKVGHHFWHLTIEMRDSLSVMQGSHLLQKYLLHLPNLKQLYISWEKDNTSQTVKMNNYKMVYSLLGVLQLGPFPKLSNLMLASFENVPSCVIAAILVANQHVNSVELFDPFIEMEMDLPRSLWPQVGYYNPAVPYPSLTPDFGHLFDLKQFSMEIKNRKELLALPEHWKLEYLRLNLKCAPPCCFTVFDMLKVYGNTLTELYLILPTGKSDLYKRYAWESTSRVLQLPKLKKLTIFAFNVISCQFLMGLKSLEYLCLDIMCVGTTNRTSNEGLSGGIKSCCEHFACPFHFCIEKVTGNLFGNYDYSHSFSPGFREDIWKFVPSLQKFELRFNIEPPKTYIRPKDFPFEIKQV